MISVFRPLNVRLILGLKCDICSFLAVVFLSLHRFDYLVVRFNGISIVIGYLMIKFVYTLPMYIYICNRYVVGNFIFKWVGGHFKTIWRSLFQVFLSTLIILFDVNYLFVLCFDMLTRPKMPFKVMHRKEVTHTGGSYERKSRGRKLANEMARCVGRIKNASVWYLDAHMSRWPTTQI